MNRSQREFESLLIAPELGYGVQAQRDLLLSYPLPVHRGKGMSFGLSPRLLGHESTVVRWRLGEDHRSVLGHPAPLLPARHGKWRVLPGNSPSRCGPIAPLREERSPRP